jgi:hypothetical protein
MTTILSALYVTAVLLGAFAIGWVFGRLAVANSVVKARPRTAKWFSSIRDRIKMWCAMPILKVQSWYHRGRDRAVRVRETVRTGFGKVIPFRKNGYDIPHQDLDPEPQAA